MLRVLPAGHAHRAGWRGQDAARGRSRGDTAGDLPDGAWLVELAGVGDPDGVAAAVATALQVARADGRDLASSTRSSSHLRDQTLVLVLDNCEHLIGEAAAIAETLLGQLPELRVIATSREALGVPGETLFPVPGLALDACRRRVRRPGRRGAARLRRRRHDTQAARRGCVPPARRLAAGARAGRRPTAGAAAHPAGRAARRSVPRAHRRCSHRAPPPADAARRRRLELRPALRGRATARSPAWRCSPGAGRSRPPEAVCSDELLPADRHHRPAAAPRRQVPRRRRPRRRRRGAVLAAADTPRTTPASGSPSRATPTPMRARHAQWYLERRPAAPGRGCGAGPARRGGPDCSRSGRTSASPSTGSSRRGDADAALGLTEGVAWLWFLQGDPHEAVRWLDDALEVPGAGAHARAGRRCGSAYFRAWLPFPGDTAERAARRDRRRCGAAHGATSSATRC